MRALSPAIDSLTVLTPLDCFDNLSPSLFDVIHEIDSSTGEILKSKNKPVPYDTDGIKFRMYIVNLFGIKYLNVVYTSKMLKEHYFDGITSASFRSIFDYWTPIFFSIHYDKYLLNSIATDVDFKIDFHMSDDDFSTYLAKYRTVSGSRLFKSKQQDVFKGTKYIGCQLVNRDNASISSPFVKFYSKSEELEARSPVFQTAFLQHQRSYIRHLRRFECTIINQKHFEAVRCLKPFKLDSVKINSLSNVLAMSAFAPDICEELLDKHITNYTPPIGIKAKAKDGITPSNYLIYKLMHALMKESSYTLEHCLSLLDDKLELSETSRSRLKSKMRLIYSQQVSKTDLNALRILPKDAFYLNLQRGD